MAGRPESLRARAAFVEHVRLDRPDHEEMDLPVTNLIHKARDAEEAWIEEATNKIGDWRSLTRSVYLRWAITINASMLAEQRYQNMPADQALRTTTLRVVQGMPEQVPLAVWPSSEAAARYAQTTPLIAAYGVADLFGALEDVIFDFYEIVLRHKPEPIIRGEEFRPLRRLWRQRKTSPAADAAWQTAWVDRFDNWRRKRAYDGLQTVLQALFTHAGLKRPSHYRHTDIADWCRTLEMIGELRHHIIHGVPMVSRKLGDLSNKRTSLTFDFAAGQPLDVRLHHLQSVECFCDQLLTAINFSLIERATGPMSNVLNSEPEEDDPSGGHT